MAIAVLLAIIATVWFALGLGAALLLGAVIRHAEDAYDALNDSADSGRGEINATQHGEANK